MIAQSVTELCTVPQVTVEAQFVAEDFLREFYQGEGEAGGFGLSRFKNIFGKTPQTIFH